MKTLYLTYFTSLMGMSAVALAKAYADIEITLPVIFFFGCCILVQLLAVMFIGAEAAERRASK
jgi:hypothetical protein